MKKSSAQRYQIPRHDLLLSPEELSAACATLKLSVARILRATHEAVASQKNGEWIAVKRIATKACAGERTVRRHLDRLVELGFVQKDVRRVGKQSRQYLTLNFQKLRTAAIGYLAEQKAAASAETNEPCADADVIESGDIIPDRQANKVSIFPNETLDELLLRVFGHPGFREGQKEIIETVIDGQDVLAVMPTSAGKSLCYQLPTIVRGGTTLVISPLISLMQDQCDKLNDLGLPAAMLGGKLSPEIVLQYLCEKLRFLFMAPERLHNTGIRNMLSGHKPKLIALDEAHCVSTWGRDFRPFYARCGDVIDALRPVPVIAVTATATPCCQEDIIGQVRLKKQACFIHSCRRGNIAMKTIKLQSSDRYQSIVDNLRTTDGLPAIVFTRTVNEAIAIARQLKGEFSARPYYAGLPETTRQQVQRDFLRGTLDVVVATIAFGMGIDKANIRTVIHSHLPATVGDYYQQIGRAGRDGQPSRAVLIYTEADYHRNRALREHESKEFRTMQLIHSLLTPEPQSTLGIALRAERERGQVEEYLQKIWGLGGAEIDSMGNFEVGTGDWESQYQEHGRHKDHDIDVMFSFAESVTCRMVAIERHFGFDETGACGICDNCCAFSNHQLDNPWNSGIQSLPT